MAFLNRPATETNFHSLVFQCFHLDLHVVLHLFYLSTGVYNLLISFIINSFLYVMLAKLFYLISPHYYYNVQAYLEKEPSAFGQLFPWIVWVLETSERPYLIIMVAGCVYRGFQMSFQCSASFSYLNHLSDYPCFFVFIRQLI